MTHPHQLPFDDILRTAPFKLTTRPWPGWRMQGRLDGRNAGSPTLQCDAAAWRRSASGDSASIAAGRHHPVHDIYGTRSGGGEKRPARRGGAGAGERRCGERPHLPRRHHADAQSARHGRAARPRGLSGARWSSTTAGSARDLGIDWTFSPVIDVNAAFRSAISWARDRSAPLPSQWRGWARYTSRWSRRRVWPPRPALARLGLRRPRPARAHAGVNPLSLEDGRLGKLYTDAITAGVRPSCPVYRVAGLCPQPRGWRGSRRIGRLRSRDRRTSNCCATGWASMALSSPTRPRWPV